MALRPAARRAAQGPALGGAGGGGRDAPEGARGSAAAGAQPLSYSTGAYSKQAYAGSPAAAAPAFSAMGSVPALGDGLPEWPAGYTNDESKPAGMQKASLAAKQTYANYVQDQGDQRAPSLDNVAYASGQGAAPYPADQAYGAYAATTRVRYGASSGGEQDTSASAEVQAATEAAYGNGQGEGGASLQTWVYTTQTTTVTGRNTLYCFALMMPKSYEVELLTTLLDKRLSLFLCDDYAIFSETEIVLGKGDVTVVAEGIGPMHVEYGGIFNTALNTPVFLKAWEKVFNDGKYQLYGWTVKVDPDCVFLPDRLRAQLANSDPEANVYLNNCDQGLHGPIEVIALGGMREFQNGLSKCNNNKKLKEEKGQWGEDVFLRHCLGLLQVNRVDNFRLLSEQACMWENPPVNGCISGKASFHPFKTAESYFKCLDQAMEHPETTSTTTEKSPFSQEQTTAGSTTSPWWTPPPRKKK